MLDKVGVEPQVQRIGAYKSAGDQLLRRDMSDAQREQLGELLDDIYENFLDTVAEARGKTREVGVGVGGRRTPRVVRQPARGHACSPPASRLQRLNARPLHCL